MTDRRLVFLGGVFCDRDVEFVKNNSKGVIQNAADALQQKLISGLNDLLGERLAVVNLPFVGAFPNRFKKLYFSGGVGRLANGTQVQCVGFVNLWGIKNIFRLISACWGLLKVVKRGDVLVVYSAHLPFLFAAIMLKLLRGSVKVCVIIPDLPEFMGEGGVLYTAMKRIEAGLFYRLVGYLDYFVVLTKYMVEKIGVSQQKTIVLEGVAARGDVVAAEYGFSQELKAFLYSGTLAMRYGVTDLVDAFALLPDLKCELWVCGEGDGKDYIVRGALNDSRIKYFGQLDREEVEKLQWRATVLVNPRKPDGDYTRFSFPSKIMEYMAAGRPIIMYSLPGIPEEYSEFYFSPRTPNVEALAECMRDVIQMPATELKRIGAAAREFVMRDKNPRKQAQRILNLIW